jgi:kumamolisin
LTGISATAVIAMTVGVVGVSNAAAQSAPRAVALTAFRGSVTKTTDRITGSFQSPRMAVEVVLAPRDAAAMKSALAARYERGSATYHQWLTAGQFDARYAPTSATRASVASYLKSAGLKPLASSSPFFVRAVGTSSQVGAAFHTTLSDFRDPRGIEYFANSTAVRLPTAFASNVLGVVGLSNTVRAHDNLTRVPMSRPMGKFTGGSGCETGYVTSTELANLVNTGTGFNYGYGGGPSCSGLTPSQVNGLYDAPGGNARTKGAGETAAVFELSAYQSSDIATWTSQFYGPHYNAPLQNVLVDGGPVTPVCPAADTCPPSYNGYSGDIEVDADIEVSLAVAPDISRLQVYEAPNDYTGQTELDLYSAIADRDQASTVSSSWGECENDAGAAYAQAENVIFEQMAFQGQSMFSSSGDTGAFSCIRSDGTTILNTLDPADQPWVTSVGGTTFSFDNPGTRANPSYPDNGDEMVWNVDNLCNTSANELAVPGGESGYPLSGYFWCAETGAGGGGSSQFWGRPFYQQGPGVQNSHTTTANGTTQCSLARTGTPCREVPDVSADADPYTGYAEYCTGSASTPYSTCGSFSSGEPSPGWFEIGGTSLSSPLWAALIADRDAFQGGRSGNINTFVYGLASSRDGAAFFHDITGFHQPMNNNGYFPTTPGFDEATGLGSPDFAAFILDR